MGADSFKPNGQGVTFKMAGNAPPQLGPNVGSLQVRAQAPALSPAPKGFEAPTAQAPQVRSAQAPILTAPPPGRPAAGGTAPGAAKIPSMKGPRAGGARDQFTPQGAAVVSLAGRQGPLLGEAPPPQSAPQAPMPRRPQEPADEGQGGTEVFLVEHSRRTLDGRVFVARYEAEFPRGSVELGTTLRPMA